MHSYRVEKLTVHEGLYYGVIHSVKAWIVYAIIEFFFACILPWIIKPGYDYHPLHYGFTALLFFLYSLIGLILGCLSGI